MGKMVTEREKECSAYIDAILAVNVKSLMFRRNPNT